jgi:serine/threonine protein kinase
LSQHLVLAKDVVMKKRLGAGAFGEVFKGTCMGEPVAIKTMLDITESNVKSFRTEIILTATLRHPNIVNFIGACWGKELICMVLEWVSKGSLTDFLSNMSSSNSCMKWDDPLLRLATDIARGMNYLHSRQYYDETDDCMKRCILHRDLKPDNVLVSEYIAGKISDFGTSRAKTNEDVIMTAVGTPLFVAPEISRGEKYDEKVDVYSFGLTLLSMTISDPILDFIGMRWKLHFNKKKIPKQAMRLIRPMTEEGWRPVTEDNPIEFAPPSINKLIIECCHVQPSCRPSFESILATLMTTVKEEVEAKSYVRDCVYRAMMESSDETESSPVPTVSTSSSSSASSSVSSSSNRTSSTQGSITILVTETQRMSSIENPMRASQQQHVLPSV